MRFPFFVFGHVRTCRLVRAYVLAFMIVRVRRRERM